VFTGHDDLTYPYRSHSSKQRLHYEMQVFGATPKETTNSTSGLIQHANGGGWKQSTATVDSSAYLAAGARVYGTAQVRNNARIEDFAVVTNGAQVLNTAVVSGHALIMNSAVVKESAKVRDWATVSGSAVVAGRARVLEHAQIQGGVVTNDAVAKGSAILWSGGYVGDWGVIEADFMAARDVTNGFAYGHLPYTGVPDSWVRTAPNRQFADYEFASANDSMIRDHIGVTDGYKVGNPPWILFDGGRNGVLAFNGTNQYVVLDKSLADLPEISVAAWIRWNGGAPNQPVWHFGSATNKAMFLTPDDGSGHAKLIIRNGGVIQTLLAPAALSTGVWAHVAVTLSNATTGRLYINGVLQQQASITITPEQLTSGNSNAAPQHHYLARSAEASQPFFNGAIDSVMIYSRALSNSEVAAIGPANSPPALAAISNRTNAAGVVLTVTNSASDADLPWQTLTFSLLNAPTGANLATNTGIFTWRPSVAQANTTNLVRLKVADNGTPSLSATQSFLVTVPPVNAPLISAPAWSGGTFALQVGGDFGPDYSIQATTNLLDWTTRFTTNSPLLPFLWLDSDASSQPLQFYRAVLGP
jgi:carbonic anhydrase/acetyltransferase-like protein (isoleucine patch superfamily)